MTKEPDLHRQAQLASANLKSFNWASEREIRHQDVSVFKEAAAYFNHIILLRATNQHSLQYIGRTNYTCKPIDCKPKTASTHAMAQGKQIPCAGLVVDPTLLPNAFVSKKQVAARNTWQKFIRGTPEHQQKNKVFKRQGNSGFYAVDTYKASPHYGCLMLSAQSIPDQNFRLYELAYQKYKQSLHMRYVYGDYDLYGLIDVGKALNALKHRRLAEKEIKTEQLFGMTSFHSPQYHAISHFLNEGIGCQMIQHGSQDTFGHGDDKLYVFTPVKNVYVLESTEAVIRDVYQLVFKEQPIERSF